MSRKVTRNLENYDPTTELPDHRHEMFAHFRAEGMSLADAYESAGYARHKQNAYILAHVPAVAARIKHLSQEVAGDMILEKGQIVIDLRRVRPDAPRLTPEWFLQQIVDIVEDDGEDGTSTADRLKALQMGADWLGYFKRLTKPGKGESRNNERIFRTKNGPGRSELASGETSALQRFASLVEGDGHQDSPVLTDGDEQPDGVGDGAPEEHVEK